MKEKNFKKLENLKMELENCLDDYSLDFVNCYPLDSYGYISDAVSEFADSHTSIYCSDQRNFYYDNTVFCENALFEFGYNLNELLKSGDTLDDLICKAGAIGEYRHIMEIINDELEDVIELMIINYILDENIDCNVEFLEDIDIYNLDRFDELVDLVQENSQKEGGEK